MIYTDWQLNGRPLPSGTKFKPTYDFGVVNLTIDDVLSKDAGVFKCTATNNKGIASSSGTLKMLSESEDINAGSLHPSGQAGLDAIQKLDKTIAGKLLPDTEDEEERVEAPRFTTDLPAEVRLNAEQNLMLECNFEPKTSTKVDINWYHNGLPLRAGASLKMSSDLGVVNLTVDKVYAKEAGIYTCKANNSAGEATTFTKVYVADPTACGIDAATKHPRGQAGLESIDTFEVKGFLPDDEVDEDDQIAPYFVTSFENGTFEAGSVAHFEAKLEPKSENITLEWLLDGKPLKESKYFFSRENISWLQMF